MKIAYATLYDTRDPARGSGTYYFMSQEIERQGHTVYYLGPVQWDESLWTKLFRKLSQFLGKKYRSNQDPFAAKAIGRFVSDKLASLDYDILLTNDYAIAGYTSSSKPIVLYTDAIFPRFYRENVHPWLANFSPFSVMFCQHVVRKGLSQADLCIFPSEWAIREANKYIPAHFDSQDQLIEFGANFATPPSGDIAKGRSFANILHRRQISLLFIGKDWSLKGGEVAIDTMRALKGFGINAVLHIVGPNPPIPEDAGDIRIYGYVDKVQNTLLLERLYRECDALLLPTKAEGFGIVFAEAAAYGMPSLSYRTTGVKSAVKDGASGILLAPGSTGTDFANVIKDWFSDPGKYDQLVSQSRHYFETTVNWPTAVSRLTKSICDKLLLVSNSDQV